MQGLKRSLRSNIVSCPPILVLTALPSQVLPRRPALLSGVQGGGAASLFGRRKPVAGFDSHVIDANFSEVVVFTSAALLPCYILNLAAPQSLRRGASLPSAATLGMAGHGVAGLAPPPASAMPTARHGGGGAVAYCAFNRASLG